MLFTYVHRQVLDEPRVFHGTEKLFATLGAASERWTFGLDPSCLSSFLAQRGLILDEDVGASDYRALYFGNAATRMQGYEFYRIAVARVPGPPLNTPGAAQRVLSARLRNRDRAPTPGAAGSRSSFEANGRDQRGGPAPEVRGASASA